MSDHSPDISIRGAAKGLRSVILAGGKGVRLQPFTINFPKPLVPLGDTPIVEVLLQRLIAFGLTDVTLALGHLADLVKAYFQQRKALSAQLVLRYVQEDQPTGTAGSLALIEGLEETFLVMNGDLLTDLDFDQLVTSHRREDATLTIAAHRRTVKVDLGVLEIGENHRLIGYREKPEYHYDVSMGIYVYEPEVLRFIQPGKYLDFPDLILRLLEAGKRVNTWPCDGLWLDVGRPDDYARAQQLFADRPKAFTDLPEWI